MITPSQFAYSNYNYWTIPLSELPTRGQFYNPNAIIKLRGLSVMEVKFLATYQPAIATEICNEILTKCAYFENITLQDLYLPDRTYLIFWIRNNSFSNRNGYSIEVKECEHCKGAYTHNIKLEDFNIKQLDHFIPSVYLPDADVELPLCIPKFSESLFKAEDNVQTAALYINTTNSYYERVKFIEELTAKDYAILNSALINNYCGFQDLFEIECPHCKGLSHIMIKIYDDNMFSFVKLFDVLETITRISKYTHLQITNDWAWIEVEMEQEVVNKLAKEEEEEGKKELAKAKAQAHVPHVPGGMPH